jgi:hypothetical protein
MSRHGRRYPRRRRRFDELFRLLGRMPGSRLILLSVLDSRARIRTTESLSRGFDGLRPPSHFLLLAQEKVTKEKGTPVPRPADILSSGCARRLRGFPTAHPCTDGKLAHILAGFGFLPSPALAHPCAACATLRASSPPTRRGTGAPLKSGALLRAEAAGERGSALDLDLPSRFWRRAAQPGSGERRHCLRPGMAEFGAGPRPASSAGHRTKCGARVGSPFFWLLFFGEAKKSDSAAEGRRNRAKESHSSGHDSANPHPTARENWTPASTGMKRGIPRPTPLEDEPPPLAGSPDDFRHYVARIAGGDPVFAREAGRD